MGVEMKWWLGVQDNEVIEAWEKCIGGEGVNRCTSIHFHSEYAVLLPKP